MIFNDETVPDVPLPEEYCVFYWIGPELRKVTISVCSLPSKRCIVGTVELVQVISMALHGLPRLILWI